MTTAWRQSIVRIDEENLFCSAKITWTMNMVSFALCFLTQGNYTVVNISNNLFIMHMLFIVCGARH